METMIDEDGTAFVSCDHLCVGDYGGAGSVGEANIRSLQSDFPDSFVRHGDYYSRRLWLPDNEEMREIIKGLEENYPLYDEEMHSEVEMEWQQEAWDLWLEDDLVRTLPEELREWVELISEDDHHTMLWLAYQQAMEKTNTYPEAEYSGVYVDVDRIKDAFASALERFRLREKYELPDDMPDEICNDWLQERGASEAETECFRED